MCLKTTIKSCIIYLMYSYVLFTRFANVVARNETGRLPLKLNILLGIIKFWIHLESLPENSIAKQSLIISNQLANEAKTSFMLTVTIISTLFKNEQKINVGS